MFVDARTIPEGQVLETDICIIGGGAAGITLARELAGHPYRVSLLESGGLEPDADTQALATGENIGLPYFPLVSTRLRLFGGTTNHWGGTCRPLGDIDFEPRAGIPYSGWPLRYADLQPYYVRAQSICQIPSPEWDLSYWEQRDTRRPFPVAGKKVVNRVAQVVQGAQRSWGKVYRAEVEQAANVITYLHANVTEIETDEPARSVAAVRVACLSGNTFTVQARLFVLAVGGIENARLLLLSNKRHPAGLGNQHDLVGRFFMEHPRFDAGKIIPADPRVLTGFYETHGVGNTSIKGYLALTDDTLRDEQLVDIQVALSPVYASFYQEALESSAATSLEYMLRKAEHGEQPDDFAKHLANVMADMMSWQQYFVPTAPFPVPKPHVVGKLLRAKREEREQLIAEFWGDTALVAYEKLLGSEPVDHIRVITRIDPAPNPDSRITLGPERDQLGQPRAQLDWRLSPIDKRSVRRTLEIVGAEVGRAGLGRLQIGLDDDDTTWPADTHGGWHHIGTTRMSDDPTKGVVDANCQVHGISNLFIAGSSVFPTAGSGTPTLTLVSLALRLADHIKERMR
jgi:choline dehydrogenase-like flavoprotein